MTDIALPRADGAVRRPAFLPAPASVAASAAWIGLSALVALPPDLGDFGLTRERTTDFFFELPPSAFAQGLERLCDMLAHPRMSLPDQLREREVLHAEFIAWTQDAKARQQISLLEPINTQHPLRGFHAGNRYSLSVPNPAFQQVLPQLCQGIPDTGKCLLFGHG